MSLRSTPINLSQRGRGDLEGVGVLQSSAAVPGMCGFAWVRKGHKRVKDRMPTYMVRESVSIAREEGEVVQGPSDARSR